MAAQIDAFTEPRARSTDPQTSKDAGAKVDANRQRDLIMALLTQHDYSDTSEGWTADEMDYIIAWRLTTAGRRLSELKRRGLVEVCGERKTRSGRKASVYRVVS